MNSPNKKRTENELTQSGSQPWKHDITSASEILFNEKLLIGSTDVMKSVRERMVRAAATNVPILIQGETGTGKEVIARFVHRYSKWNKGRFVKVSCAAIPHDLLESELFGYEEGAFTGATQAKPGLVEASHGGTLFFDEIAEMDTQVQAKLLHFMQDKAFMRIGGGNMRKLQMRVLCTTNRNLEAEMAAGRFRPDLFYRISGVAITLPPLRERKRDIPALCNYFVGYFNAKYKRSSPRLSHHSLQLLSAHNWPGNIRELENLMSEYVIFGNEDVIHDELLGRKESAVISERGSKGLVSLKSVGKKASQVAQRKLLMEVLEANQWSRKAAARVLNISYRSLLYKVKEAGIPSKRATEKNNPISNATSEESNQEKTA